jgi:hypothetical protein
MKHTWWVCNVRERKRKRERENTYEKRNISSEGKKRELGPKNGRRRRRKKERKKNTAWQQHTCERRVEKRERERFGREVIHTSPSLSPRKRFESTLFREESIHPKKVPSAPSTCNSISPMVAPATLRTQVRHTATQCERETYIYISFIRIHTHQYLHTHTHTHTHIYTYTYMNTHTHTHTHTPLAHTTYPTITKDTATACSTV